LKYITSEGLFLERQKFTINPIKYTHEIINCIRLLNIDFSETLNNISQDRILVIRSKNDNYFCDELSINFLKSKNIKIVEIRGGHNWNEEMERAMNNLIA
jgi:hypothetical protein